MSDQSRRFPHIYLPENGESEKYTRPQSGGGSPSHPQRDRAVHARALELAIGKAIQKARQQLDSRQPEVAAGVPGFYLEFQVQADGASAFEKLENRTKKIELVAVNQISGQEGIVAATVFVPEKSTEYFLKKIKQYRDENNKIKKNYFDLLVLLIELLLLDDEKIKDRVTQEALIWLLINLVQLLVRLKHLWNPKNEALISRVETIQIGTVKSLFTDDPNLFPKDGQEIWWEVWLRRERRSVFEQVTQRLDIRTKPHTIIFPEREIVLVMSNAEAMARVIINSDAVAELRIAKDIPSMFLEMGALEQSDWAEDLARRLLEPGQHAVAITLLDSGVTRIHQLLSLALTQSDMYTVEPSWGVNDSAHWRGHGTAMAGVALYADLLDPLLTSGQVKLLHRLESVKILPTNGENDPDAYGWITEQGVSLPEIQFPDRRRVFCMAVTSGYGATDTGTPSSWSAAVDQLCFNDNEFRRLMIISAGNIYQDIASGDYLSINDLEAVENPAQAWNSLVVGAYTEKVNILDPGYAGWQPLAPGGDLSPRSRTSVIWEPQWPIRPDVVFEGGNMAHDGRNPGVPIDDLCVLTTHYRAAVRAFDYMRDTSCATALASYMAARIMSEQPTYRPETIRALIVHSAEWTPAMGTQFNGASSKTARRALVRRYGYGVPDLGRALQSASNDLTLIAEDELQPFYVESKGGQVKTKDMNLHRLPWPSEVLEELGEANVELKVTLSYFIEPNPGERGRGYKHRYASHGLRFKVKGSLETYDQFRWQINKAVQDEEEGKKSSSSDEKNWFLGPNTRDSGSVHCDIWKGSAVELAQKDAIAVYPVGGWWKEKKYLERYNQVSYYTLIVSIRVPEIDVDIYTPVENLVKPPIPVGIQNI